VLLAADLGLLWAPRSDPRRLHPLVRRAAPLATAGAASNGTGRGSGDGSADLSRAMQRAKI
jgi:hypothetical protein